MGFKTSPTGSLANIKGSLASPSGIPAMYGTGDYSILPSNETQITASDGGNTDFFGFSVAVGSGRIVVGAFFDDSLTGSAYIFDLDGNQLAKITASDGATSDQFGRSVAVGSGKIVVGAPIDNDNGSQSGSAYIFDLDGNQLAKITASDAAAASRFGWSVAVGSGRIVVGAEGAKSAYIFDLNGNELAKITASDGTVFENFGYSVAVGSGKIVVGNYKNSDNGINSGSAHIFDLDGNELAKITASDAAADDQFGYSVAVGSGKIVVGANLNDDNGLDSGSAYIFDLNGNELKKITASDGAEFDGFGRSVAVGNGRIVVGAPDDDDNGSASGSAYIFDLDGNQLEKINGTGTFSFGFFGEAVAIDSAKIVIGSYGDELVYIYDTPNVLTPYDVQDWERG